MNKNKKSVKYGIIVCICILFFSILIIRVSSNKEYPDRKSNATEEISMSIVEIDSSEDSITDLQKNGRIKVEFEFSSISTSEYLCDMILLANYEQVSFSINGTETNMLQRIRVPLSEDIITTDISIEFTEDSINMLDCILLLKPSLVDDSKNISSKHFVKRFIARPDGESLEVLENQELSESTIPSFNPDILITLLVRNKDNELKIDRETISELTYNFDDECVELEIYSYLSNLIDVRRFTSFEDLDENNYYKVLMFAVSDNKIVPMFRKENFNLHKYYSKQPNVLSTTINKSEIKNDFSLFLVSYPFEHYNNKLGTYQMVLWDTVLSITSISINEK